MSSHCFELDEPLLQPLDLFFEQIANAVLGEINLSGVHAEAARDFAGRLAEDDLEVVNLIMLRLHLSFNPRQRGLQ